MGGKIQFTKYFTASRTVVHNIRLLWLQQAGVECRVSGLIWTEILEKRNSLMTTFLETVIGKCIFSKLEIL